MKSLYGKHSGIKPISPAWLFVLIRLVLATVPVGAYANGEAVVVNMIGGASARVLVGPVHEGRSQQVDVFEGGSLGETAVLQTDRDGQLCMVLSPGAVMCVAPGTRLRLERLRHTSSGLPQREEDLVRRIHIRLERGRILLHAGPSSEGMDIRVVTDAGVVQSGGGTFSVSQQPDGSWAVFNETDQQTVIADGGDEVVLRDKGSILLTRDASGQATARRDPERTDPSLRVFEVCDVFFADLGRFFMDPVRFDRTGLGEYIRGKGGRIDFLGGSTAVLDASPSFRPIPGTSAVPGRPTPGEPGTGGRWGQQRIWDWYGQMGPIKGVNYVPRYAVNSVEMWMADTFDAEIIDEELGWAHAAGFTSVRVPLQYAVWVQDQDGFLKRFDRFLAIARENGLRVVPVLFDDLSIGGDAPALGPQPDPEPGVHNSRWLPSPGREAVQNRDAWPSLEAYVKAVMQTFRRSDDVLFWDLYNVAGAADEWDASLPLMDQAFIWARATDPQQPIAVSAWTRYGSAMSTRKLERSDLVTFQSFDPPDQVEALLLLLRRRDRPIICTGWLMRQRGNDFGSMLPLFANHQVGWFSRGLVNGRTQLWVQQENVRSVENTEVWQHDVFHEDGEPYRREEIEAIQAFTFEEH